MKSKISVYQYQLRSNSHKVTWQLFSEATRLQKYVLKVRYFKFLFYKILIKNIIL